MIFIGYSYGGIVIREVRFRILAAMRHCLLLISLQGSREAYVIRIDVYDSPAQSNGLCEYFLGLYRGLTIPFQVGQILMESQIFIACPHSGSARTIDEASILYFASHFGLHTALHERLRAFNKHLKPSQEAWREMRRQNRDPPFFCFAEENPTPCPPLMRRHMVCR